MRWCEVRSAEFAVIISYPTSAHKISRTLPDLICKKTNDFQLVFDFEQTRTVTVFGEHALV